MDARELPDEPDALVPVLEEASVFGRVTPQQKRSIVQALQSRGHVVAMTGDGVNDALALKDADIGVAMGSGAPATRAVAQIVLLDGRFARMPGVVAEGRRVIANIERVANLFVTKTFYATLLAVAVGIARWPYPFLPRQLTIVSSLTIGIPAFFLALEPEVRRYIPGFVRRVLQQAGPAGAVAAAATFTSYAIARSVTPPVGGDEQRTAATLTLLIIGLWVLNLHARPITPLRGTLFLTMVGLFVAVLAIPALRDFFALDLPRRSVTTSAVACAAVAVAVLEIGWTFLQARRAPAERVRRIALRNPAAVAARGDA
jgi:cation-transporting ATPase E